MVLINFFFYINWNIEQYYLIRLNSSTLTLVTGNDGWVGQQYKCRKLIWEFTCLNIFVVPVIKIILQLIILIKL